MKSIIYYAGKYLGVIGILIIIVAWVSLVAGNAAHYNTGVIIGSSCLIINLGLVFVTEDGFRGAMDLGEK